MDDPWKFLAFPVAGVVGYLISIGIIGSLSGGLTGLGEVADQSLVIGGFSLLIGFLVDEVIPTYIRSKRGSSGASPDIGGDDLDDL